MSSPLAGKFQDHYEVLGVEPRVEVEAIQLAYAKLAQKYNPSNRETADPEKFDAINAAYEVLCDPLLRREFDKIKGIGAEDGPPKFSGHGFFDALARDKGLRITLLSVLYDRRRTKPFTPSLSMRQLESMLEATSEEINFALWYLKQRTLASSDDKSSLQITVEGMDYLEGNRPSPEMVLTFIKPGSLPGPKAPVVAMAAPPAPPSPAVSTEEASGRTRVGTRLVGFLKNNAS